MPRRVPLFLLRAAVAVGSGLAVYALTPAGGGDQVAVQASPPPPAAPLPGAAELSDDQPKKRHLIGNAIRHVAVGAAVALACRKLRDGDAAGRWAAPEDRARFAAACNDLIK